MAASRWNPAALSEASRASASSYSAFRSLAVASFAASTIAINPIGQRNIFRHARMRFPMNSTASGMPDPPEIISYCFYRN
jgi:hypothetical protein